MHFKHIALLVPLSLVLIAAGCRSNEVSLGSVAIATAVDRDNAPINEMTTIVSSEPAIYLSAQINNATLGTVVDVEWRYLTGDQLVATESFRGDRTNDKPHEFITQVKPATSYFYSRLSLRGFSWSVGSYEVNVRLNNQLVRQVGFNIVDEAEFDELTKKTMLKSLYLGSRLNNQNQIAIPGSLFERNQPDIYAVVLLQDVPVSTKIRARWRYLPNDQVITDFSTSFSGGGYLPFGINLDRFSRLWTDGLWPIGTYQVEIYVDNVLVATKSFSVS